MTTGITEKVTPTISTGIYAAGDCIGGLNSISRIVDVATAGGFLHTVAAIDKAAQKVRLDLIIFDSNPSASTFTDNATLAINAADIGKIVGTVPVAAADYVDLQTGLAVATVRGVGFQFDFSAGRDLYFTMRCGGTPTYTAATDLDIILSVVRDR